MQYGGKNLTMSCVLALWDKPHLNSKFRDSGIILFRFFLNPMKPKCATPLYRKVLKTRRLTFWNTRYPNRVWSPVLNKLTWHMGCFASTHINDIVCFAFQTAAWWGVNREIFQYLIPTDTMGRSQVINLHQVNVKWRNLYFLMFNYFKNKRREGTHQSGCLAQSWVDHKRVAHWSGTYERL